jgi:hypothetical protein
MKDNLFNKIFENVYSKSFLAILGLFSTILSIYAFIYEQKPNLKYEIISNTKVIDLNAQVNKLEIVYNGANLKTTHENLRIFTLKVINTGSKEILKTHFDENDPIGLALSSGRIIDVPRIIQTSNNYLKKNTNIINYSSKVINFNQVILEPDEYFIVKILVLYKMGEIPKIKSTGKIAGQKEIVIANPSVENKDESVFFKAFSGNFLIQLLRFFAYFITIILAFFLFAISSVTFREYFSKRRLNKIVEEFKKYENYKYSMIDEGIFASYKFQGSGYFLKEMATLINDDLELNRIYQKLQTGLKSKEFKKHQITRDLEFNKLIKNQTSILFDSMVGLGLVFKENDRLIVNLKMKESLNKFIDFLKEKGYL